jgi:hypothetical protein
MSSAHGRPLLGHLLLPLAPTADDLIHHVASSCLSNRLPCNCTLRDSSNSDIEDDDPFADAISSSEKCRRSPSMVAAEEEDDEEEKLK